MRRGYDPTPYLPALVGTLVGSAEASDKFLWDFAARWTRASRSTTP